MLYSVWRLSFRGISTGNIFLIEKIADFVDIEDAHSFKMLKIHEEDVLDNYVVWPTGHNLKTVED